MLLFLTLLALGAGAFVLAVCESRLHAEFMRGEPERRLRERAGQD